jgi:hypothetical protein
MITSPSLSALFARPGSTAPQGGPAAALQRAAAGRPAPQRPEAVTDRSAADKKVLAEGRDRARAIAATLKDVRKELAARAAEPTLRGAAGAGEVRARLGSRDVYGERDVFETRGVYEDRPVTETRDVYETRDVTETRPVFGVRDVLRATVTGTRNLVTPAFQGWDDTGIVQNAEFTVKVGSRSTATIRFQSNERIRLTVDGVATQFNFTDTNGNWRGALLGALNAIQGLDASYNAEGRLVLSTEGAETLALGNGRDSPLDELGLSPGTTLPLTVGTETVQVGTETVVVGQERVKTGEETVVVGSERVKTGEEQVRVGSESYVAGREDVVTGYDYVTSGAAKAYEDRAWVSRIDGDGLAAALDRIDRLAGRKGLLAGDAGRATDGAAVKGEDLSTGALAGARLGEIASKEQVEAALKAVDAQLGKAEALIGRLDKALDPAAPAPKPRSDKSAGAAAALAGSANAKPETADSAVALSRQVAEQIALSSGAKTGLGFGLNSRPLAV